MGSKGHKVCLQRHQRQQHRQHTAPVGLRQGKQAAAQVDLRGVVVVIVVRGGEVKGRGWLEAEAGDRRRK